MLSNAASGYGSAEELLPLESDISPSIRMQSSSMNRLVGVVLSCSVVAVLACVVPGNRNIKKLSVTKTSRPPGELELDDIVETKDEIARLAVEMDSREHVMVSKTQIKTEAINERGEVRHTERISQQKPPRDLYAGASAAKQMISKGAALKNEAAAALAVEMATIRKADAKKSYEAKVLALQEAVEIVAAAELAAQKAVEKKVATQNMVVDKAAAVRATAKNVTVAERIAREAAAKQATAEELLANTKDPEDKAAAEKDVSSKAAFAKEAFETMMFLKKAFVNATAEKLTADLDAVDSATAAKEAALKFTADKKIAAQLGAEKKAIQQLLAERTVAENVSVAKAVAAKQAAEKATMERALAEEDAVQKRRILDCQGSVSSCHGDGALTF